MKWIVLYSRSGNTMKDVAKKMGILPDLILTTHELSHDKIMDILRKTPHSIVTLMGYLRIIPPDVCDLHEMYNYHPAPISLNPNLKGLNPIEKHATTLLPDNPFLWGGVLHRVVSEVDAGEILYDNVREVLNERTMYDLTEIDAVNTWVSLLTHLLKGDKQS